MNTITYRQNALLATVERGKVTQVDISGVLFNASPSWTLSTLYAFLRAHDLPRGQVTSFVLALLFAECDDLEDIAAAEGLPNSWQNIHLDLLDSVLIA